MGSATWQKGHSRGKGMGVQHRVLGVWCVAAWASPACDSGVSNQHCQCQRRGQGMGVCCLAVCVCVCVSACWLSTDPGGRSPGSQWGQQPAEQGHSRGRGRGKGYRLCCWGALEFAELDKSLVTRQGGRTRQEGSCDAPQGLDKEAMPTCCKTSKLLVGLQTTAGVLIMQLLCAPSMSPISTYNAACCCLCQLPSVMLTSRIPAGSLVTPCHSPPAAWVPCPRQCSSLMPPWHRLYHPALRPVQPVLV